jgi:RNA polymerase sigma-70 factor (ECF subfamily)
VLGGDPQAYAILVRRYQDRLYHHAERMTDQPDDAADIVQASFIRGYERLSRCRDVERVGAWLFRINANACKDYLKNRRRRNLRLDDASPLTDTDDPEAEVESDQAVSRINTALDGLSVDEREAFVLKHVEGLSYQEMADMLGTSISALKMRVHRARGQLQHLLEDYR